MMRRLAAQIVGICGVLVLPACLPSPELVEGEQLLVLSGATLVDGSGRAPVSEAEVVVGGGRVIRVGAVGDFAYPPGTEVVDLTGRWLLPGLIEMHTHLPAEVKARGDTLDAYLRYGVTTVVDPGASLNGLSLKAHDFGRSMPQVISAGRLINGLGWLAGRGLFSTVTSAEETRDAVREDIAAGADLIKTGPHLNAELVCVAVDEAHRHDTKLIAHLGVTAWGEAVDCGVDMIVHSGIGGPTWELIPEANQARFRDNILTPVAGLAAYDASLLADWRKEVDLSGARFQNLVSAMRESGVTVDPNLVVIESIVFSNDPAVQQRLNPGGSVEFSPHGATATWDEEGFEAAQATWPTFLEIVRRFHDAGVPLTAGSDLVNPWITAGPGLHRELELLVSAGIAPIAVITIATRNPATFLGLEKEIGGVFEGGLANLLVLRASPLEDISNTTAIEAVYLKGRRIER